jgi:hypothetical protein
MQVIKINESQTVSFMAEFVPFECLWEGADAPYNSEFAARWAIRKMRPELAAAKAVAKHRNRLMVHPQRFAVVAENAAIQQFARSADEDLKG